MILDNDLLNFLITIMLKYIRINKLFVSDIDHIYEVHVRAIPLCLTNAKQLIHAIITNQLTSWLTRGLCIVISCSNKARCYQIASSNYEPRDNGHPFYLAIQWELQQMFRKSISAIFFIIFLSNLFFWFYILTTCSLSNPDTKHTYFVLGIRKIRIPLLDMKMPTLLIYLQTI